MEYASAGKGNAALTTGIIGTVLGGIASAGGIGSLLGLGKAGESEGDRPVTRYEMSLMQAISEKNTEIAMLKAQQYTDGAMNGVQAQIAQQNTWNAVQQANFQTLQAQTMSLMGMTQRMIPGTRVLNEAQTASASTGTGN
jgi:hypothetical protein